MGHWGIWASVVLVLAGLEGCVGSVVAPWWTCVLKPATWSFMSGIICRRWPIAEGFARGDHLVVAPAATLSDTSLH